MSDTERATVAGGCFWCIEAPFKELRGVESVISGYCGGETENPSYEAVCRGDTGHAEAVQVEYDPEEVTYEDVLAVFFTVHDPTTVDRQGPDTGPQYRSAIFYHDEAQRDAAEAFIDELEADNVYEDPVVTEVSPLETFYEAEAHHQDYFEKNPNQPYCVVNINPKLKKLRERFADKLERAE